MTGWIIVVVLYVLGICFFNLLGGIASASSALRRWGRSSAGGDNTPISSSF